MTNLWGFLSRTLLALFLGVLWQFSASSTGRPVECHRSGSPDKKPARCCPKEHPADGRSHQRGGHRHQGYHWWHWGLVGQTQAASRRGQGGDKEQRNIRCTYITKQILHSTASEQHARCDHLDAERREAGSVCSSSSQRGPVFELQRTGPWQTLWTDPDHIHAGARLDWIRYLAIELFIVMFQYLDAPSFCLSVPDGQK